MTISEAGGMEQASRRTGPVRHPVAAIVLLYGAVRMLVLALGMRFDAANLTSWMQIADLALLRQHLWRTLWYLHTQPPLFNLMIGLAIRLGPDGFLWAMGLIFAAVTLGGILAVHGLIRALTGRAWLALLAAGWLCVSPAVLLFSQKLYYDGLLPWLLCMGVWGLHAGCTRRSTGWFAFGFAMLSASALLKSMMHPVLFVAIVMLYLVVAQGQRRRVIATAALPAAAIVAVLLKNLIVFGSASLSSWAPLQLDHTTVDRLPVATRVALIRQGKLSHYAVVDGFSPPSVYLPMMPPIPPTGEPSLDNLRKSTGEENWNHILYTMIGTARTHDALVGLAEDPKGYAKVLATSLYHFHRPASEFKGLEANLAVIAPWERIANAVVALQPAAWFGGTLDPRRPQAPLLQISYAEVLTTLAFVGAAAMLAAGLLGDARARRLPRPDEATLATLALLGGWTILVSSSFDVWENNRAHYDIAPILMIAALVFADRMARRFAGRETMPPKAILRPV